MISLHEFGHFIAAKLSGVKVFEFAIGMGPAIFKKQKGETLYSVRIFPIGGYCSLEGEDAESDSPSAFNNQKLWKRFIVVSAGAILNILLGFVLSVVLMSGVEETPVPVIESLVENTNTALAGIEPGDRIVEINGHKINFYTDVSYYLSEMEKEQELQITVKRNGEKHSYSFLPSVEESTILYEENGAKITTSINGVISEEYVEYNEEQKEYYSDKIGETSTSQRLIMGFVPEIKEMTFTRAVDEAYHYTFFVVKMVYDALGDLVTGKTGIDQFSGPVGIATVVDEAVHSPGYGIEDIINIIVLLTINLGVFNLLPLPALDGGRLVFILIEFIFRKPVPPEKEGMVHAIGMVLLMLLAVVVLFNDVLKLF